MDINDNLAIELNLINAAVVLVKHDQAHISIRKLTHDMLLAVLLGNLICALFHVLFSKLVIGG